MIWLDDERILGGGIIAWSKCQRLWISGKDASSAWDMHPDEGSLTVRNDENEMIFNANQAVTARLFIHEFLVDQHPDLFFEVDAKDRQAVVKIVFDRWLDYSPLRPAPLRTLYVSENISGKGVLRIPLAEILRKRGYRTRYMRVTLCLEIGAGTAQKAHFRGWSDSKPVLVAELPRSRSLAGNKELVLNAVLVDGNGELLHEHDGVCITASGSGRDYKMTENNSTGIFQARVVLMKLGNNEFLFEATRKGADKHYYSKTSIGTADGEFVRHHYDTQGYHAGYIRGQRHLGFMSGSTILSDAVAALNVGTEKEKIILDAHELLKNTGKSTAQTGCVWMTSLNEDELQAWLEHRRKCGYRVFLMSNWSPEVLNAGGTISPYGSEITALIFNYCRQHDIYLRIDLTHNTFSRRISFPNLTQYKEAGFLKDYEKVLDLSKSQKMGVPCISSYPGYWAYRDDSWCRPGVRKLTEQFFRQFCILFRDETAIILLSPCGESDFEIGARLVNPFIDFLRKHDQNHLLLVDLRGQLMRYNNPAMNMDNIACPHREKHTSIACVAGYGKYKNDIFAGVMLKFFGLNPNVGPAEGDCYAPSWPSYYEKPFHPAEECMRLMVRDFLWLCLVHRYFMAYNWNELFMAEEHLIPAEVSRLIDWQYFQCRVPPVFLRIHGPREAKDAVQSSLDNIMMCEEIFSRAGLEYDYIWEEDPLSGGAELFVGPDRNVPPYLVLDVNYLPKERLWNYVWPRNVEATRVTQLESTCYAVNSCVSEEGDQAVFYLRNNSNYITREWSKDQTSHWFRWKCQRGDLKRGDFKLELANLSPNTKKLRVYDLNTKAVIQNEKIGDSWNFSGKDTTHDFAIVVYRKK